MLSITPSTIEERKKITLYTTVILTVSLHDLKVSFSR